MCHINSVVQQQTNQENTHGIRQSFLKRLCLIVTVGIVILYVNKRILSTINVLAGEKAIALCGVDNTHTVENCHRKKHVEYFHPL